MVVLPRLARRREIRGRRLILVPLIDPFRSARSGRDSWFRKPQSRRQAVAPGGALTSSASRAEPGGCGYNSAGDELLIHKPNQSAESQSNVWGPPVVGRASCVVGFAGCDSVESSEVVNRLLVADSRGSFTPGYAWLARRACAYPGLLPVASFAALRDEKTESVLVGAGVLPHGIRFWCHASIVSVISVEVKIFVSKCREAAIGSSPG